jgi:glutaredoxin-related protein
MPRAILDEAHIHPAIRSKVANHQATIVAQVQAAIAQHPVVVVGMKQNPYPKKACKALHAASVAHEYLEFGGYMSQWRERNALKLWTGWPTFPLIFVKGTLVGGYEDLQKIIDNGELKAMLA